MLAGCGDTGQDILASVTDPSPQGPPIIYCPTHTRVIVTPLQVSIGSDGELHAMADSQAVSFAWTGTRGVSISTPANADALFTCLAPGPQTLTLRVTGPASCVTRYDVPVTCASP